MGLVVACVINGGDGYLDGNKAVMAEFGQHGGFVLEPLTGDAQKGRPELTPQAAKACLRVLKTVTSEQVKQIAGAQVADLRPERNGPAEPPGPQHGPIVGAPGGVGDTEDIFGQVLAIRIRGDDRLDAFHMPQNVTYTGLEGAAFAAVQGMAQHMDTRQSSDLYEDRQIRVVASVINDHDSAKTRPGQRSDEPDERFAGLPRRNEHGKRTKIRVGRRSGGGHVQRGQHGWAASFYLCRYTRMHGTLGSPKGCRALAPCDTAAHVE